MLPLPITPDHRERAEISGLKVSGLIFQADLLFLRLPPIITQDSFEPDLQDLEFFNLFKNADVVVIKSLR